MSLKDKLATTNSQESPQDEWADEKAKARLALHRARVTSPSEPHDIPRDDLGGKTAFEAALLGASGDNFGDGAGGFDYSRAHGHEDLVALIGDRTDLGPIMTHNMTTKPMSILAYALGGQDGASAKALIEGGAELAEGENPVEILVNGQSYDLSPYTTHHDEVGFEKSLIALKSAGHDLNAPIDGRPPAFRMVEKMASDTVEMEEVNGPGDKRSTNNISHIFRTSAEAGIDFQARDKKGRSVLQSLDQTLASEARKLGEDHPVRTAIHDAVAISKDQAIRSQAQARAAKGRSSAGRGRDDDQR